MAPDASCDALRLGHEIVLYAVAPKFDGKTTNQDTYRHWPLEARAAPPEMPVPERIKFEGTTTNNDTYKQHDIPPRPSVVAILAPPRLPFQGCSTSHDAFKGIQLPPARRSVGLATAHGHHILLNSNARLPAEAQQLFTTLHDGQNTVHVVLLEGETAESARVLGEINVDGIPYALKGVPRILIDFRLSASGLLTVHAKDLDGPSSAEWQQIDASTGRGSTSA